MTARRLAVVFVLYGLVATAFLAVNIPPFQGADEQWHFMRAAQVADGGLIGTRFISIDADGVQRVWAGGAVDAAVRQAFLAFAPLILRPDMRVTKSMWPPRLHWTGTRIMLRFPGTAVYPPLFYLPSAIGVLVGRASRMTITQTLVAARLVNAVAAVAVGAVAIGCAGGAAVWLFAILTLPESLSLIASPSQEAELLACSALAGALLLRALRWPGDRDGKLLAALAVTLVLLTTARPPYGVLAVLPLALTKLPLRSRMLASGAIAASALLWSWIAAATALTNVGWYFGADPAAQMARLRGDPLLVVRASWQALTQYWSVYLQEFVGRIGWLDLDLPPAYHAAARAMLMVAVVAAMLGQRGARISIGSRLLIAIALLVSAAAVFAIEYVIWTAPGAPVVNGVLGRYFLPLALVGAALLPSPGVALLPAVGNTRCTRLHDALVLAVAAFPAVSLAVVMHAVVLRYYLG